MMKHKVIFMPHANIQYSQLPPSRREWVIENCYRKLFDLVDRNGFRMAFEASGRTVDEICATNPKVMDELTALIKNEQIEPVASPYTHFMVSNVPSSMCVHSLKRSLDAWERATGFRPSVGWNPECSWSSDVIRIYKDAGLGSLVMDADSLFMSFSEIRKRTGLKYDVVSHSNKNKLFIIEDCLDEWPEYLKFLVRVSKAENGLQMLFRSDCMANILLWYLMGASEEEGKEPVSAEEVAELFIRWKNRLDRYARSHPDSEPLFIMPYAEDAEYIGSTAYFYVKHFNQARFFEPAPESVQRFEKIVKSAQEAGFELALPEDVSREGNHMENPYIEQIDDGVAWHGGTARAWLNTDYALLLDPACESIYSGVEKLMALTGQNWNRMDCQMEKAVNALESAWVSDSRWPPAPCSPGRFNVEEAVTDLKQANGCLKSFMEKHQLMNRRSYYSPMIMETQIRLTESRLMSMHYFGE